MIFLKLLWKAFYVKNQLWDCYADAIFYVKVGVNKIKTVAGSLHIDIIWGDLKKWKLYIEYTSKFVENFAYDYRKKWSASSLCVGTHTKDTNISSKNFTVPNAHNILRTKRECNKIFKVENKCVPRPWLRQELPWAPWIRRPISQFKWSIHIEKTYFFLCIQALRNKNKYIISHICVLLSWGTEASAYDRWIVSVFLRWPVQEHETTLCLWWRG